MQLRHHRIREGIWLDQEVHQLTYWQICTLARMVGHAGRIIYIIVNTLLITKLP